jgi:hypothetical protein
LHASPHVAQPVAPTDWIQDLESASIVVDAHKQPVVLDGHSHADFGRTGMLDAILNRLLHQPPNSTFTMPNFTQLTRWQRLSMSVGVCAAFAFIQQPAIAVSTVTMQYPGGSVSQTVNSRTASSGYSAPTGQATASSAGTSRFGLQGTATYDPANPSASLTQASKSAEDTLFFHLTGSEASMDVTFIFHGDADWR